MSTLLKSTAGDFVDFKAAPIIQYVAVLALGVATFSRLLESELGFPRAVNWVHFPIVCAAFAWSLLRIEKHAVPLFLGVIALLLVFVTSALVNGAAMINACLGYMLLVEPFLLLAVVINTKPSEDLAGTVGAWVLGFALAQIPIGLLQWPRAIVLHDPDYVQGSFRGMGPGAHVLGAISMTAAFYVVRSFPEWRAWWKALLAVLLFFLVVASDSKQIVLGFCVCYLVFELCNIGTWKTAARLAARVALLIAGTYLAFRLFDPRLFVQAAPTIVRDFARKFEVFPLITARFDSLAGWIFGLGPGHTVSRMGGWLIDHYWNLLQPLGATRTDLHNQIMNLPWVTRRTSSFFLPMFSWAGIFGDIGVAGILAYSGLLCVTYFRICVDRLSRFLVVLIVVLGFVFDWLEEYNFMLYVAAVIGQRWLAGAGAVAPAETSIRPTGAPGQVCQSRPKSV